MMPKTIRTPKYRRAGPPVSGALLDLLAKDDAAAKWLARNDREQRRQHQQHRCDGEDKR
jgi:hypothetical protein